MGGLFISAVAAWAELLDLCRVRRRVLYVGGLLLPLRGRLDTLDEGEAQAILESGKVPRIEDKSTFFFFHKCQDLWRAALIPSTQIFGKRTLGFSIPKKLY